MPRVTAQEAERAIMRDGWYVDSSRGSHRQYRHPLKGGYVTIAHHRAVTLDLKTVKSIIDQAGLTLE